MRRRLFIALLVSLASGLLPAAGGPLPGQIILVENIGARRSLVRLDPNTGKRERLTDRKSEEDSPCLSPDGKSLLFAAYNKSIWQVRRLDMVSRQEGILVQEASWPICWLSEREFLATNSAFEICVFNEGGKLVRKLSKPIGNPLYGAVVGKELIYGDLMEPPRLMALHLDTGAERKLVNGSSPSYSAPLRSILYWDTRFFSLPLANGKPTPVKQLDKVNQATYSPDGNYLAWTLDSGTKHELVIATNKYQVLRRISVPNGVNTLYWGP